MGTEDFIAWMQLKMCNKTIYCVATLLKKLYVANKADSD